MRTVAPCFSGACENDTVHFLSVPPYLAVPLAKCWWHMDLLKSGVKHFSISVECFRCSVNGEIFVMCKLHSMNYMQFQSF